MKTADIRTEQLKRMGCDVERKTYFVLAGEGEQGTWTVRRTNDIERLLRRERCGGDRWAIAVAAEDVFECEDGQLAGPDNNGRVRRVPNKFELEIS